MCSYPPPGNVFGRKHLSQAWNKLHDEMKIYAGYFRFIVVLALVAARAVLFQEISLSSSRAAAFNMSAALVPQSCHSLNHSELGSDYSITGSDSREFSWDLRCFTRDFY